MDELKMVQKIKRTYRNSDNIATLITAARGQLIDCGIKINDFLFFIEKSLMIPYKCYSGFYG